MTGQRQRSMSVPSFANTAVCKHAGRFMTSRSNGRVSASTQGRHFAKAGAMGFAVMAPAKAPNSHP
jgi:hypothetical protein